MHAAKSAEFITNIVFLHSVNSCSNLSSRKVLSCCLNQPFIKRLSVFCWSSLVMILSLFTVMNVATADQCV